MPSTLANFTSGGISDIQTDDWIVGYDTAVLGGERRWSVSTIANAVSGLIKNEMANFMNNTLTLGNYPYMEYALVTAPNATGQTCTANVITPLNIDTTVYDTQSIGSLASNAITLPAGTYQYEAHCNYSNRGASSAYMGAILSLNINSVKKASGTKNILSNGGGTAIINGVFNISTSSTITLSFVTTETSYIESRRDSVNFTNSTAGFDQRTTIKLWKVG